MSASNCIIKQRGTYMNIKLDLKIFIFIAIFILTQNINIYAILMFFGLIHELGHLLCGLLVRL